MSLKIAYPDETGALTCSVPTLKNVGLLYPSPQATLLSPDLPEDKRPETLLVLDGTWFTAHKLYKGNRWLSQIPHFTLQPSSPSRYRIRQEPSEHCISTLEAIVEALRILEPQTDFSSLIHAFDAMIDRQLVYIQSGRGRSRYKRPRKRAQRCVPKYLVERFNHVVVVYTENIRVEEFGRVLVSCCAVRMGDGQTFESFVQVPAHVANRLPELEPSDILEPHSRLGVPKEQFIASWRQFLRDDDVLCAWNKGTLKSLFQLAGPPSHPYLYLKAAYGNTVKEKFGTLEEVIEDIHETPVPMPFFGRAKQRMGNAVAVARYLHHYTPPKTTRTV